jgi:hypothetical protein
MKQGKARFQYQLAKIEKLFSEARLQENPALWLFLHDLRTPMFMLEGLSKMYTQLHDKKAFTKLRDTFKVIEDLIGAVDYYAAFIKEFSKNELIPNEIKFNLDKKTREKLVLFNEILRKDGWLDGKKLKKLNASLNQIEWLQEEEEVKKIHKFYLNQIEKIKEFVIETTFDFDNVETDVHELRRKLRWLSIYPQALRGVVQLHEKLPIKETLNQYLTPEIVSSPFNILPVNENLKSFVFLEKNHFLAMSWMIAELGKIKDNGLRIKVLKDSFQEIYFLKDEKSFIEAYMVLGKDYPQMDSLLRQASNISQSFFKEKILDFLVLSK